ncbi:unnamed protein product [Ceutorhynchus assimilis]|uniref:F-box domain-containing protein n=1 Tax=Ceutorhynchus assimilis TaxID=467358 RepID=A0A9N9MSR6_9CUCU|nr:unnamed protein product [Ceutorhynchus assimilis]
MGLQERSCKILQLSDCAMMYILSNLDATSLFQLSRTCHYFKNIVEDPKLWEFIEARKEPNSTKKVQYVCDRIHDRTTHILMRAESRYDGVIPQDTLLGLNQLQNLRVLALENQRIDGKNINLQRFPRTLVELSLKKSYVRNGKQFFHGSFMAMSNLRVLILDECDWLDSNFFISIAKYPNLEILSIIKCMRLHFNVLPYLSIARHACKQLKIIDCRFNTISNEVLMQASRSVMALYFQSMSSHKLDTGVKLMRLPQVEQADERAVSIRNESLYQFQFLTGHNIEELPQSLLYQDPYPECSCKWKNDVKNKKEADEAKGPWPVDDYIDFDIPPTKFICRRHMKDLKKLPKNFKNFFYDNQKKFYPSQSEDSNSDDDSDSEDNDRECCMFGVGKTQQMIVLKVREADEQGNLPQPEVINLFDVNDANRFDVNPPPRASSPQPGPSTSGTNRQAPKRKAEDEPGPSSSSSSDQQKKQKLPPEAGASTSSSNMAEPSPSRPTSVFRRSVVNTGPTSWSRLVTLNERVVFPVRAPYSIQVHHRTADRFDHIMEQIRQRIYFRYYEKIPQDANKTRLRRLSLRGYRAITDEALISIRNLNLDLLDVTYTRVTKEGISNFLVWNPNCRVLHPDYCVCKPRIPC